jgi:hypothetical protein
MRKFKVFIIGMAIATAGFASEDSTSKINKISEIENFFKQNQVYSVEEKNLQQISEEKLDNLYQEIKNIEMNGFKTSYKNEQVNLFADLLSKSSLNLQSKELLDQYGMLKETSKR